MERIGAVLLVLVLAQPTQAAVEMFYLHNDHLGTPRVVTNQLQQVVWKGHLKPFGETQVEIETITNHRRFPGQRFDIESRLHYNYFRDYDPRTGRYIQSDPIGLLGGLNTYAYVTNNPLRYIDPLGLDGFWASQHAQLSIGSGKYSYWSTHPDARGRLSTLIDGRKSNKCNLFVNDMLALGGDAPGQLSGRPPSAEEWADPNVHIPGYSVISLIMLPQPGDVVAFEGHVGIFVPSELGSPRTVSVSAFTGDVVRNDWGFRPNQTPTLRRCDCDMP